LYDAIRDYLYTDVALIDLMERSQAQVDRFDTCVAAIPPPEQLDATTTYKQEVEACEAAAGQ